MTEYELEIVDIRAMKAMEWPGGSEAIGTVHARVPCTMGDHTESTSYRAVVGSACETVVLRLIPLIASHTDAGAQPVRDERMKELSSAVGLETGMNRFDIVIAPPGEASGIDDDPAQGTPSITVYVERLADKFSDGVAELEGFRPLRRDPSSPFEGMSAKGNGGNAWARESESMGTPTDADGDLPPTPGRSTEPSHRQSAMASGTSSSAPRRDLNVFGFDMFGMDNGDWDTDEDGSGDDEEDGGDHEEGDDDAAVVMGFAKTLRQSLGKHEFVADSGGDDDFPGSDSSSSSAFDMEYDPLAGGSAGAGTPEGPVGARAHDGAELEDPGAGRAARRRLDAMEKKFAFLTAQHEAQYSALRAFVAMEMASIKEELVERQRDACAESESRTLAVHEEFAKALREVRTQVNDAQDARMGRAAQQEGRLRRRFDAIEVRCRLVYETLVQGPPSASCLVSSLLFF